MTEIDRETYSQNIIRGIGRVIGNGYRGVHNPTSHPFHRLYDFKISLIRHLAGCYKMSIDNQSNEIINKVVDKSVLA